MSKTNEHVKNSIKKEITQKIHTVNLGRNFEEEEEEKEITKMK